MLQFKHMNGFLPFNLGFWEIELSDNSFIDNINIRYTVMIYIRSDEKGAIDHRINSRTPLFEEDPETKLRNEKISDVELVDGVFYRMFRKYPSGDKLEEAFTCAETIVSNVITKLQSILNENGMEKSAKQNFDLSLY